MFFDCFEKGFSFCLMGLEGVVDFGPQEEPKGTKGLGGLPCKGEGWEEWKHTVRSEVLTCSYIYTNITLV